MSFAIVQILIYSTIIFSCAALLRPSNNKPKVEYMSQNKVITKERI